MQKRKTGIMDSFPKNQKKDDSSNAKSKDKAKEHSTSKFEEDIEQSKGKRSTNRLTSHSSDDERKHVKSSKKQLFKLQECDSDNSSSEEFLKMKRQKEDLEIEQSNPNLSDHIRGFLRNYKMIVLSNLKIMDVIMGDLYRKDEEQPIPSLREISDNLKNSIVKMDKDLKNFHQFIREISAMKRSCNAVDNDGQSLEECGEWKDTHISGDERGRNKDVLECESEEIFSADETRTPQEMRAARHKAGTSTAEDA